VGRLGPGAGATALRYERVARAESGVDGRVIHLIRVVEIAPEVVWLEPLEWEAAEARACVRHRAVDVGLLPEELPHDHQVRLLLA